MGIKGMDEELLLVRKLDVSSWLYKRKKGTKQRGESETAKTEMVKVRQKSTADAKLHLVFQLFVRVININDPGAENYDWKNWINVPHFSFFTRH